jgi:hypothetical protein
LSTEEIKISRTERARIIVETHYAAIARAGIEHREREAFYIAGRWGNPEQQSALREGQEEEYRVRAKQEADQRAQKAAQRLITEKIEQEKKGQQYIQRPEIYQYKTAKYNEKPRLETIKKTRQEEDAAHEKFRLNYEKDRQAQLTKRAAGEVRKQALLAAYRELPFICPNE